MLLYSYLTFLGLFMITNVGKVLSYLMKEQGLTSAELARLTGVLQPVVYRIASGETDNPKIGTLIPIANHFGISINQLVGIDTERKDKESYSKPSLMSKWSEIPIIEWNQLTLLPDLKNTKFENHLIVHDTVGPTSFALQLIDTTLSPKFPAGTILVFDPDVRPKNLDFVLAHLSNQEITFKQLLVDGSDIYLKPLNPDLRTVFIEDRSKLKISGVLVKAIIDF